MTRLSMKTIKQLNEKDLRSKIQETRSELSKLRIDASKGTLRKESGKLKPLRHDIARMMTRLSEMRKREMITADNITSHEFIGLDTEIIKSTNPQVVGLNGRIINETKSMFTLNTQKGAKNIAKSNNDWKFSIQGKDVTVEGAKIAKRPFDRIGGKA